MAWIEVHTNLPDHPKVLRAAKALKLDSDALVGKLIRLWTWAVDNRSDGRIQDWDDDVVANIMRYKGKPERLFEVLVEVRLLDPVEDGGYAIHDWYEHIGGLIEQREAQKAYAKRHYALYNDLRLTRAVKERDGDTCQYCGKKVNWKDRKGRDGGTYDHIDPDGDNTLENLCVACRSCNSSKKDRLPWEAGMQFIDESALWQIYGRFYGGFQPDKSSRKSVITVPNRTLPNKTDIMTDTTTSPAREEPELSTAYPQLSEQIEWAWINVMAEAPTEAQVRTVARHSVGMDISAVQYALELACLYGAANPAAYAARVLNEWNTLGIRTGDAARAWRDEQGGV